MNQEHETQPMRSTNFEFLRATQPKLADDAAAIESLIHERPAQAINLMRSFAEHLLHAFVIARGREGVLTTGDQGKRTIEFDQLLHECESKSSKWLLSAEQLRLFRQIKSEGNKAVHDAEYHATSPMKLLEATHTLAALIAKSLKWATPSDPCRKPPHGGEEAAELRRQRDEAMREAMQQVVLPEDWIREPKQYPPPSAPKGTFVGRESLFREINNFIADNTQRVLLIEGQPGRGKSALLAHFIAEQLPTGIVPIYFFFEDGKDSIQTRGWIRHFYASTLAKAGLTERDRSIEQVDPESLVRRLAVRLHEAAEARPDLRLLLIIDAIDEAGAAKNHAIALLGETLPQTVQILATARPNHVKPNDLARTDARVLDLEQADQVNQHRNDGREYLRQRVRDQSLNLSESQLDEIGKLGDGNFLVLREICRDLPKDESQFDPYLRNLADLRGKGIPLREELERRAWDRLQRLDADELHHIQQTLGLLAVSQERLPERVIKSVLKLRKADFQKVMQQAGEYIATATIQDADTTNSKDDVDEDPEGLQVHRLYDATFAELVRRELKDELPEIQGLLCEGCRNWWQGTKKFERAYALRHLVEHLQQVQDWAGLEAVLTDLQFIQARFEAGQGHDLLAEYDTVLKAHPQQDKEFKQRIEQDAALHQYVQDIVEYSRRCTEIRNRHERGACDNPVAEIRKLIFPDPPDTTQTIKDMRRTEERQKNPTKSKPLKSTGFTRIRDFQQFIAARLQLLLEVPHAIIDIALNYGITGAVAEAAQKSEPTRNNVPRLIQHDQPIAPELNPLVLRSIDYIKALIESPWVWMNPGATVGFIGNTGYSPNALVDLRTCRSLTGDLITYGTPRAVSMDGHWALLQSDETGPLTLVDLKSQKILGECDHVRPGNFLTTCNLTPDGALVVGIGDAQLVIWNKATSQKRTISLEDFDPEELLLCHTGIVAAVRSKDVETHDEEGAVIREKGLWAFINLIDESVIEEVSDEDFWSFVKKQWFFKPFHSAVRTRWPDHTGDGKLALRGEPGNETNSWVSSTRIVAYQNDRELRQFRGSVGELEAISADGRYGFAKGNDTYAVFNLANGCDTLPASAFNDSTNAKDTNCASEMHHFGDEQGQLRTELQLEVEFSRHHTLDENQSIAGKSPAMILRFARTHEWELPRPSRSYSDCFAMTLDASVVVTKVDATSLGQLAEYQKLQARHLSGEAKDDKDFEDTWDIWGCSFRFEPNAAALTCLASGDHLAVEHRGEWLGLTRDGRTLIFRQYEDAGNAPARLRFWSIQHQDWLSDVRRHGGNNAIDFFTQSSDGRMALADTGWTTPVEIVSLNRDHSWVLPRPIDDRGEAGPNLFTPDARFLLDHSTNQTYLWSLKSGDCVGIESGSTSFPDSHLKGLPWIDCDGFLRDGSGRKLGIEIRDPDRGPAWVTAARLYRIGSVNGQLVPSTGPTPVPFTEQPIPGTFDDDITFCCRRCGRRSPLPTSVIAAVDAIHRNAHLDAGSVPVLELPDDAWDDEPGLDFPCPECGQRHRSTPFYVDRRHG